LSTITEFGGTNNFAGGSYYSFSVVVGGNGNITQNSNIQRVRNKQHQLNALFENVRDIVLQNSPRFFSQFYNK
jgi:hypothetical protein